MACSVKKGMQMALDDLVVCCVDIGSVAKGNFGWARNQVTDNTWNSGEDPAELCSLVANDLNSSRAVALGFECPLYVPLRDEPENFTRKRACDVFINSAGESKSRPWSAGAGCGCLVTGLVETVWILQRIRSGLSQDVPFFLDWTSFSASTKGLYLWEAFVTDDAKANTHSGDAEIAVRKFTASLPDIDAANADDSLMVHSLIGAALLRTGWSTDVHLLETPCVVLRA
jgi:hypothetical protein